MSQISYYSIKFAGTLFVYAYCDVTGVELIASILVII